MSEKEESSVGEVDASKEKEGEDVRIDIRPDPPSYCLGIHTTKRPDVFKAHKQMMDMALADAGRWCYGVKAIDIWILGDNGRLVKAEAGSWVDPIYVQSSSPEVQEALSCIYDPENPEYKKLRDVTVLPGYGLAGTLWSDTNGEIVRTSTIQSDLVPNSTRKLRRTKVIWRDIFGILKDEDNPSNPLLPYIVKAGFAKAAGIPFNVRGLKGIVIFMARRSVRIKKLESDLNEEYMLAITEHIGAVMGLRVPRRVAAIERTQEVKRLFGVIKNAILGVSTFQKAGAIDKKKPSQSGTLELDQTSDKSELQKIGCSDSIASAYRSSKDFWKVWFIKISGGSIPPPPPMPWRLTMFVALFSFLQCIIMFRVSGSITDASTFGFIPGQVASGISMLYTLTSAPAGQPRTLILGRLLSIAIGMTLSYIPVEINTPLYYFRLSLTIALSTSLMARFQISHPPGAVLATTFLKFSWHEAKSYTQIGILLLQDIMLVVIAAIFVNLNNSRSYPTYWGYLPHMVYNYVQGFLMDEKEKEKLKMEKDL